MPPPVRRDSELRELLASRAARGTVLDAQCKRLVAEVRRRCPGVLKDEPVKPGEPIAAVTLSDKDLSALVGAALAAGDRPTAMLSNGDSELLLHAGDTTVVARDGLVLVALTVECDQTGPRQVTVPFAVGSAASPAGLVAVTEPVPRGPWEIVGVWGETLVALAWRALLEVASGISRHAGGDVDAMPLLPGAIDAVPGSVNVTPQARHEIDRSRVK